MKVHFVLQVDTAREEAANTPTHRHRCTAERSSNALLFEEDLVGYPRWERSRSVLFAKVSSTYDILHSIRTATPWTILLETIAAKYIQ